MKLNEKKMLLDAAAVAEVFAAHSSADEQLLDPLAPKANVIGYADGVKWRSGQPTGEPALLALVTRKLPPDALREQDVVPGTIGGAQTDVLEVGHVFAGVDAPPFAPVRSVPTARSEDATNGVALSYRTETRNMPAERAAGVGILTLAKRVRPAKGGYSVGHYKITAGTIATCVYDILPGGTGVLPLPGGVGKPQRYYILSNNHVLAASNAGSIGDPILQPGPYDGGIDPADRIAVLSRYIPIIFDPPVPRAQHNNLVDAAIAEGQFHDLDREVHWDGRTLTWRRKVSVPVGLRVQKVGRTSNLTFGRVTGINAVIDVNYGGGQIARFRDQIVTTDMSNPGDSGSLVVSTEDNAAVGLLFAGSSVATILNQIENVRTLLKVEVAEVAI